MSSVPARHVDGGSATWLACCDVWMAGCQQAACCWLNSGVSSLVLPLRNKLFTAGLCLFELLAGLGWIGLGLLAAWAGKLNSRVLSLVSSRRN